MKTIIHFFRTLNREAAFDSLRNILAVLGVGTVIGDFASKMPLYFILPAMAILFGVWYIDYIRHDFNPIQTSLEIAERLGKDF